MATIARNDPCPCGSGQKYKKCCLKDGGYRTGKRLKRTGLIAGLALVLGLILGFTVGRDAGSLATIVGLVAAGAHHLFSDPPDSSGPGNPGAINFGR